MTKFDWKTDEEKSGKLVPAARRQKFKRPRFLVLLIMFLVIITGILMSWQLNARIQARAQAVEQDVLASFQLWQHAVERSDAEMLDTLLADGVPDWTTTQRKLLTSGLLLDRSSLGLNLPTLDPIQSSGNPEIELSPDWRSAQLTFEQAYSHGVPGENVEPIHLKQTVVFERVGSRWILSKPGIEYWGDWLTWRGSLVTVTFRKRDESIAKRLGEDLDLELESACVDLLQQAECPATAHIDLQLESDPRILLKLVDRFTPIFSGRSFVLPTPTLVGLPVNETAYRVTLRGYVDRLVNAFVANLENTAILPNQDLYIVCYAPQGLMPSLFRYDLQDNIWTLIKHERSFSNLSSNPADDALVLWEHVPDGKNTLSSVIFRDDTELKLLDRSLGQGAWYRVVWTGLSTEPQLFLQSYGSTPQDANYVTIDTSRCSETGCTLTDSEGLPLWSPDGQNTLVQRAGELSIGDRQGHVLSHVGQGFSPFWIDNEHFGFARYVNRDDKLEVDLLLSDIDQSELLLVSGIEQLEELLDEPTRRSTFIEFITTSTLKTGQLLIYGRQYAGEDSRYIIFSASLDGYSSKGATQPDLVDAELIVALNNPPAGYPSALVPSGFAPFSVSPDGRWLTVSTLEEKQKDQWSIQVFDLGQESTQMYETRYPSYSFRHPFYDWSADGLWLVIVDDGFLRLVSPSLGTERFITHGLSSCAHPAWINEDVEVAFKPAG